MIFSDKLLERKNNQYYWNIEESKLSEFYEALFSFLFEKGNMHKLDEFLEISGNRLQEYITQHEKRNNFRR